MTDDQKQLKIAFVFNKYNGIRGYKEQEVWSAAGVYKSDENLVSNNEFQAELVYSGFSRGRSSLNIQWIDHERKRVYYSGMSLLDDVLNKGLVDGNMISGTFYFKKQGTSILLQQI